jgi:hypothetical protein
MYLWEQFYGYMVHHFSHSDRAFLDRSFYDVSIEREHIPGPLLLQIWLQRIFLSAGLEKTMFFVERRKTWMSCVTEPSELQNALTMKCLPVPVQKLYIVLMCVVPLMVAILRSAEHI